MKYVAFVIAGMLILGLALFDRAPARGEPMASMSMVDAGPPPAAALEPPEIDAGKTVGEAFNAFKAGRYFAGVALMLVAGVWAVRKWGGAWARSDRGGALLALLAGQAAAFSTLGASGLTITAGLVLDTILAGVVLAATGAGTRHVAMNAAAPPDKRITYSARPGALR